MRISQRVKDEVHVVVLKGRLAGSHSVALRESLGRLVERQVPAILLDLQGLVAIDSSGLATLLECVQRVAAYGGRFAVFGAGSRVKQFIEIFHLDQVLPMFPDEGSALRLRGAGDGLATAD